MAATVARLLAEARAAGGLLDSDKEEEEEESSGWKQEGSAEVQEECNKEAVVAAAGPAHAGGPAVPPAGGAAAAAAGSLGGMGAAQRALGGGQLDALQWPLPLPLSWQKRTGPIGERNFLRWAAAVLQALQVHSGSAGLAAAYTCACWLVTGLVLSAGP